MRMRRPFARLLIAVLPILAAPSASADTTKILLVATPPDHAWGSHMYEFDCDVLAKCLDLTDGVEAESIMGWPPHANELSGVRSVVFYSRPVGEMVLHPDNRDLFRQLMDRGVGLVAIHWSTGIGYSKLADNPELRDEYRTLLGGWFRRPPCGITITRTRLTQLDAEHPICRGWSSFELRDEIYTDVVLDDQSHRLLQVQVGDEPHTVAWTKARPGGGRSFGITLGHFHENFARPEFRRVLINGILWTAHVEPPRQGAPVELNTEALQLLPKPEWHRAGPLFGRAVAARRAICDYTHVPERYGFFRAAGDNRLGRSLALPATENRKLHPSAIPPQCSKRVARRSR